jgi:putative transposase
VCALFQVAQPPEIYPVRACKGRLGETGVCARLAHQMGASQPTDFIGREERIVDNVTTVREEQAVKKSKFTEEQISFALKQAETGTPVAEVIRRMGISEQTFYRWKQKYGGLGVGELRRLKQLEDENRKLKQLVADLSLDKHILQEVLSKKV